MKLEIYWDNIAVMKVSKVNGKYMTILNEKHLQEAVDRHMPISLIANIPLISVSIPSFIEQRLPCQDVIDQMIPSVKDEETNILQYIEKTHCKNMTDKFTVTVLER